MKKITILALAMASAAMMQARQLSPADALQRLCAASPTVHRVSPAALSQLTLVHTATTAQGNAFYVFDTPQQEGFVILAADDLAPDVLGYTEQGVFDADNLPEGLRYWMGELSRQIALAIEADKPLYSSTRRGVQRQAVSPLVSAKWGQGDAYSPFYNDCPQYRNEYTVTGCVATAMAQVMYKHQYPSRGQGSKEYTTPTLKIKQSANFNTTYDWGHMLECYGVVYNDNSTETRTYDYNSTQGAAVAKLMHHVGVSVNMDYNVASTGGSGALSHYVMQALYKYFKYDAAGLFCQRDYHNDEEWEDMLYNELANDRPVYYSGATAGNAGHAFVLDGYRNGYYHVNWGWNNMCNGYYAITGTDPLHPEYQGTGGSPIDAGFGYFQDMIIGVQPARTGSRMVPNFFLDGASFIILDQDQNPTSHLDVDSYGVVYADVSMFYSASNDVADYCFGVKMVNAQTGATIYRGFDDAVEDVPVLGGVQGYYFDTYDVPDGNYRIYPVTRFANDAEWTDIHLPVSFRVPVTTIGNYVPSTPDAEVACANFDITSNGTGGRTLSAEIPYVLNVSTDENDFVGDLALAVYTTDNKQKKVLTDGKATVDQENALGYRRYFNSPISVSGTVPATLADGHYQLMPVAFQKNSTNWTPLGYFDTSAMTYDMSLHPHAEFWLKGGNLSFTDPGEGGGDTDPDDVPNNSLYISENVKLEGSQLTLPICMKNGVTTHGFQFDIYLPSGVTFAKDSKGIMATMSTSRTTAARTDVFDCELQPDGALRVICCSTKGYAFSGNDGEVARITLNLTRSAKNSPFTVEMRRMVLADKNAKAYKTANYTTKVNAGAIDAIAASTVSQTAVPTTRYTLDGKRAERPFKGINIIGRTDHVDKVILK